MPFLSNAVVAFLYCCLFCFSLVTLFLLLEETVETGSETAGQRKNEMQDRLSQSSDQVTRGLRFGGTRKRDPGSVA